VTMTNSNSSAPSHVGISRPSVIENEIGAGVIWARRNIMDAQSKGPGSQDVICFGPFRLFATERVLEKCGDPVQLGSRALDILIALVERPAEVVSKKELIAKVWPDLVVDEGSLRFHISALRKALGEGRSGGRYVTNVSGRGYCFVARISRAPSPPALLSNSLAYSPVGLPPSPTRMVGRDETVQLISEELTARRFLTVVGPGGIGKTTVANAVSRSMLAAFDGAVHYVDFGPLSTPSLVPNMVASTLGLPVDFEDPLAALPAFLCDRRMLLVLDSCEHLIGTVAPLAERIFREAPEVHILATSREPLQVEGEQVHLIHPLAFPPDDRPLTAAGALTFPAVPFETNNRAVVHVVDDDASLRGALESLFDSVGLATRAYGAARDFLNASVADKPGCIVIDIRLPDMSGLECQAQLTRMGVRLPVIMMTGYGDIPMTVCAMKRGAVDFLPKPFRDQDMLDAVMVAIERDRQRRTADDDVSWMRQRFGTLTAREQQVMMLVTTGKMNKQVAGDLGISEITVKIHRGAAMRKMGARTLADLVRMAEVVKPKAP
jgi:FixJ family two-component response regulator/DNA-binding winged helix-turn-helix (wHTH) protein